MKPSMRRVGRWTSRAPRARSSWRSAYRTIVNHPLVLRMRGEELLLVNADDASRTQGIDLFARYHLRPLRFTASYSYIDATRPEIGQIIGEDFEFDTTMRRVVPLNPRHALNLELAHERENDQTCRP